MNQDSEGHRCVVCRTASTSEAYELDAHEMDTLVEERGVRNAAWLLRKYGAIPICRSCFDGIGFALENERPGEGRGLVSIRRRRLSESATGNR